MHSSNDAVVTDLISKALSHHQAGQLDHADALYREILKINPRNPDALHLLGLIHHQLGNHQLGIDLMFQAVAITPTAAMYCNLGVATEALGNMKDAAEHLKSG